MRLEQLRSSFEGGTLGAAVRLSILPTVLLVTLASLIAIGGCSQPEEVASDEPRAIGGAEGPSPDFDGEHDASTLLSSEDDAAGGAGWFADDAETGEPRAEQPVEATDEILASALAESESPAVGIDASIDADARDGEDVVAAERSTETSSDDVTLAGESEIAARSDSESPAGDADATAARRERAATFLARLRNDLPPAGLDVGAAAGEPASTARSRSAKDASKNAVNGAGARDARSFLDDLRQGEEARSATEANAPSGERPVELAQASPAPGGSGREAIDLLLEELEARHGKGQTPEPAPVYRGGDPQEAPPAVEPPPLTFEHEIPSPLPEASASGEAAPVASAFERAGQHSHIVELFHKTTAELFGFLSETYPDWIQKGHIYRARGRGRSIVVFTERPIAEDPTGQQILHVVNSFDNMDLEVEYQIVRPRYIEVENLMKALVMAGLANVWELTEEQDVLTWQEGNQTRTATRKKDSYIQTGMVKGASSPVATPDAIPFVYEIGRSDPFQVPERYTGRSQEDRQLVRFDNASSTEERGGMMAVGTREDIERIFAFIDSIDRPARQVMIEVQVIELDANKLSDFGIDSLQFGGGHSIANLGLPLPGEPIIQPGFGPDVRADPEQFVPPVNFQGLNFSFDDTSVDLSGRFLSHLHWLVREGDASIKARPKILTLDDRTSVLHIGREEPVFESTGVTRDTTNGNIVNEIRQVTMQYVGFTLNIRPRVTGGEADEVSLQMEVIVNELGPRQRVFAEDLAGIPSVTTRHYVGMNRVKNHRPIILGGLIQEQEVESVNKIPLLADIPLLGYLFRRTQKSQSRNEIILVVTPHILSETGVDPASTPKESAHFDTFDSVLFNDRHIVKGSDLIGVDPIRLTPAQGFKPEEAVDLTLLNIIKKRELVSKLDVFSNYFAGESRKLSWLQRRMPERTVKDWSEEDQEVFFRAAAILIENMKKLNDGLTFEDLVMPRRELIVPTSPYRISLSYDSVRSLQELGTQTVFRDGRVEVDDKVIQLLRDSVSEDLRGFAAFLEKKERQAADHKDLRKSLEELYRSLHPRGKDLSKEAYADLYRELADADIDFMTLATYFQTKLEDYAVTGSPDLGLFVLDLVEFHKSALDLRERARRLKTLEERWLGMNREEDSN